MTRCCETALGVATRCSARCWCCETALFSFCHCSCVRHSPSAKAQFTHSRTRAVTEHAQEHRSNKKDKARTRGKGYREGEERGKESERESEREREGQRAKERTTKHRARTTGRARRGGRECHRRVCVERAGRQKQTLTNSRTLYSQCTRITSRKGIESLTKASSRKMRAVAPVVVKLVELVTCVGGHIRKLDTHLAQHIGFIYWFHIMYFS